MTVHIQDKEFWVLSDFYCIEIADSGKQNKQQLIKEEIFQATWDREAQWGWRWWHLEIELTFFQWGQKSTQCLLMFSNDMMIA